MKKVKSVSSTFLTHNTNEVIGMLKDSGGHVYINSYNKPVAVLVDVKQWKELKEKQAKKETLRKLPTLEELRPYMTGKAKGPKIDSAKIIREWRDSDG